MCAPSLSSKKTPLRWMKRSSLCSATIVHWASVLGRPVSGRATQYSHAVPTQPGFFCRARDACLITSWHGSYSAPTSVPAFVVSSCVHLE